MKGLRYKQVHGHTAAACRCRGKLPLHGIQRQIAATAAAATASCRGSLHGNLPLLRQAAAQASLFSFFFFLEPSF